MIDSNTLHNAGMIPTLDTFSEKLAEAAYPQGLPIVAALRDGFELDESTIRHQPSGRLQSVYLNARVGGFTVHLLQKR